MMITEEMNMNHEGVEAPDYYGEDGLLHCGVCHEAKEAYFPDGKEWLGRRTHPRMCLCDRTEYERLEKRAKQLEHEQEVSRLRARCFTDKYMNNWTFENDNGLNPKMKNIKEYVSDWETKEKENFGLLLWGGVGTGKSYMAGCIANALLEQEVSVQMTNFAAILNDLNSHYSDRNEFIQGLCRNRLLIIDDLGICFQRILKARRRPKVEPMIGNKIGFLFLDKNGMPKVAGHWEKYFKHMVGKYNRTHTVQLPEISPHVCRHTYCTNMARAGMNPKSLQYLMGHSEVATTMDVYTHFGYEEAKKEVEKIREYKL